MWLELSVLRRILLEQIEFSEMSVERRIFPGCFWKRWCSQNVSVLENMYQCSYHIALLMFLEHRVFLECSWNRKLHPNVPGTDSVLRMFLEHVVVLRSPGTESVLRMCLEQKMFSGFVWNRDSECSWNIDRSQNVTGTKTVLRMALGQKVFSEFVCNRTVLRMCMMFSKCP